MRPHQRWQLWVSLDLGDPECTLLSDRKCARSGLDSDAIRTRRMLVLLSNEEYDNARQRALHFTIAPAHTVE